MRDGAAMDEPIPGGIEAVKQEARKLLARAEADDLEERIRIRFNARMRTRAGACSYRRIRRDHVPARFFIDLNPNLLLKRHPAALVPTLAHELAHAVVRARHGGRVRDHGAEWKSIMRRMGHAPERCHDMDVVGLERKSRPGSRWVCLRCNKVVDLGPVQTRRELRRRGTYTCLCGGDLRPKPPYFQQSLF